MNAGSRDEWIGSRVVSVTTLSPGKGLVRRDGDQIAWGYRSSSFASDEVIVECPRESAANCGGLLKRAMEEAARAILPDVPTTVDVRAARRWSEK